MRLRQSAVYPEKKAHPPYVTSKKSVLHSINCQLDIAYSHLKRESQLSVFIKVICGHVCEELSWLLTDVGVPRLGGTIP